MTTLQEYLNHVYPEKEIKDIKINSTLEGVMDLKEYTNLNNLSLSAHLDNERYLKTIQSIPNKNRINTFIFAGNNITDPNFDYLGDNFPNLDLLRFTDNPIDPNLSVKGLGKCKYLRYLWLGKDKSRTSYRDMASLPASLKIYNQLPFERDKLNPYHYTPKPEVKPEPPKEEPKPEKPPLETKPKPEAGKEENLNSIKDENERLKKENQELEKTIKNLNQENNNLETEKINLEIATLELDKNNSDLKTQLKNREEVISNRDNTIKDLESKVENKDKVISERDNTVKNLKEKNQQLEQELKECRKNHSQLKASQVDIGK